jgi:hypothetical protein
MSNTDLTTAFLRRRFVEEASTIAFVNYGCDLDRLDPAELEWYVSRVTEANFNELANDLADAAWQAY